MRLIGAGLKLKPAKPTAGVILGTRIVQQGDFYRSMQDSDDLEVAQSYHRLRQTEGS